jgi:hypothetical protein
MIKDQVKEEVVRTRKRLTTPRSAAIAGILFALLFGGSLFLIRSTIPSNQVDTTWLGTNSKTVGLALNLVPYAGIAFLWFIGVIRDRFGELEDRLFATVFLGSGLLFLALIFVGATLAGGLLNFYSVAETSQSNNDVTIYSRQVMYQLLNVYAIRMEGVFMISLGTIWLRTGLMPRAWAILTYGLALLLLVSINFSLWVTLVFPGWVLAVSITFLIQNLHKDSTVASEPDPDVHI